MMDKKYKYKVIVAGTITEIYAYGDEQIKKIKSKEQMEYEDVEKQKKKVNPITGEIRHDIFAKEIKIESDLAYSRKKENIQKTKVNLRRLIDANIGMYEEMEKFLTLTFDEDVTREYALDELKKFMKRLRYLHNKKEFKYIAVIELTKKGRIHFHLILFNLPYIKKKEISEIWRHGYVQINSIYRYYDLATYVVKYIKKTLTTENFIPKYKKFFLTSKNMYKPKEYYLEDDDDIEEVLEDAGRKMCEFEFESEFVGEVYYSKFQQYREVDETMFDEDY